MCSECNCARSCENKERDTDQTEAGLSSSALLILDANTGSANRPRRKCNLSIQSSTGTGLSLSIMPSGAYPVGDNALLAEHWVVNHWSGGHSCTFRDQFPHQTPRSVVAAHMDHFDPCRSPSREKFHSWIPIDFRHNRVAVLTILVKNFHSKLLPVCPAPPPWLHPTGTAHICRILKLLNISFLKSKLLLSLYLRKQTCFLCEMPRSPWAVLHDFTELVCR